MSRRGVLLFAVMSILWGIPYLFIRVAVLQMPPTVLVFGRSLLAALILLPLAMRGAGLLPVLRRWRPLVAFAAIEIALPWYLISDAEQRVPSSLAGLLLSAVPLAATLIAIGRGDREGLRPVALAGLGLGSAGVAAIVGLDIRGSSLQAVLELLLTAVCYATGPVILARGLAELPSSGVMGVSLGLSALVYAPLAALQWPHSLPSQAALSSIVVLALFCTALAFVAFSALIAEIGPVRATVITYVNPAVAAVVGVAVLRETLTFGMGLGFLLVLSGSVLATRRPAGRHAAVAEAH
jgi:drug/metabolite transporter (DMT)-like permease